MNKKNILSKIGVLTAVFTLNAGLFVSLNKYAHKVEAYDASSLPTTIDLNDCNEQEIRSYYSNLNSLSVSERQGTNLLKNLKTILSNGQKYYNYDSGSTVWQMYEISDRDWVKSPASSITYGTYNASTNTITDYQYGTSNTNGKNNPYLHALYIDRDIDHQVKAWGNHNQDMWGINREHIWAKSHGFQAEGAGGARGDPMHLWAANGYANNIHSNYFYAFVDKTRTYEDCGDTYSSVPNNLRGYSKNAGGSEKVFEPQDSDKGDIARSIFYMVARYNNYAGVSSGIDTNNPNLVLLNDLSENSTTGTSSANNPYGMGLLRDLLAWNKLDPVDEYEIHRNNLLYKNYTNNRNPFIDFPNWADAIWGTANLDGTNYNSTITTYASPATDSLNVIESNTFSISTHSLELDVNETAEIYATNASSNISWSIEDATVASLNKTSTTNNEKVTITALKGGTTTITATSGSNSVTCTVTVGEVINYGTLENPLSVDEALSLMSSLSHNEVTEEPLYVKGIVTSNTAYNSTYKNYDYAWLQNNDGSEDQAFELYRFKLDSGVTGSYSAEDSMVGKEVIAYGYGKNYNGTLELATADTAPKNPIVYEINDPEPTGIELDQETASVDVGDTVTLTASLIPNNAVATIVWESSDESVATVNNGVVTGVSNGQAIITARASEFDLEAECIVTVSGGIVMPSDYLNNATSVAELRATETKQSSVVTKSLTFANAGLANTAEITNVKIGDVTLNGDKGTNTNAPKYYDNGKNMRVYKGNTITFVCEENMTSIKFTYTSTYETGLTASVGALNGTTWTGNSTSVSFTNTNSDNSQVRITAVEITYGTEAIEVDEVKLDFGFDISVADWTAITTNWEVTDYGVMLFKSTKTTFNSLTPVKDAFELGYTPAIIHEGTKALELGGEGYYSYRGTVEISSVANYGLTFMAAPFIYADGQYYFFEERQESVYSLAEYYKTHSGCELSYNALLTILANQGE